MSTATNTTVQGHASLSIDQDTSVKMKSTNLNTSNPEFSLTGAPPTIKIEALLSFLNKQLDTHISFPGVNAQNNPAIKIEELNFKVGQTFDISVDIDFGTTGWQPFGAAFPISLEDVGFSVNYNESDAPTITSLGTTKGSVAGGTQVVVHGTNLENITSAKFGTVAVEESDITKKSPTSVTLISPKVIQAETVTVIVTSSHGSSSATPSSANSFTYTP
ncbi:MULTISPECIES: IPT/TIG domain-containing protein [unclassified Tenacibaculum]|uniref:IPT/TIG domain-containing protein n=1 Tax=unclassified Tenacibaculum TaxID=2635139 RepID=UPI001F1999AC|nr:MULTISPECIES: IPT/TIG domain-containing protein [unclassified Tenacibaculum]MCF2874785.1 IPT/TIG domain-containing protein [Tenacibaculum sp. Cn5-1]MCF2934149.1 IPT/TIG domain-containing protein [Tenacibaculum sp. Cn5-34]MCG7510359.1 IPT/TIG domain-containing protein [Tenacibaculum sp. Cn5-46]